ncbi:unnamed protein product [Amoebophrya sp. A120]|nr:unnamed protein product [Amoebophrya sp. A120]|eukprot:GSA120T00003408001.1
MSVEEDKPDDKLPVTVWVEDPVDGFVPGEIVNYATRSAGDSYEVGILSKSQQKGASKLLVGKSRASSSSSKGAYVETRTFANEAALRGRSDKAEKTFDDCAGMLWLHDAGILDNLRQRYLEDKIYSYTSTVLFAVNPYKPIEGLYTEEQKSMYHKLPSLHSKPPHPYAIGDLAYRKLVHDREDQAILISGESGAGKTQTAKIVMGFLVENSSTRTKGTTDDAASLDNMILRCATPILESLGNATTIRNNNSSRFGKFSMLVFNARGDLVGGEIRTYLLESSRVAKFGAGERTYHIFYEILAGASAEQLKKLGLQKNSKYALLYGRDQVTQVATPHRGAEEATNFTAFCTGLKIMNFSPEQIEEVLETLGGLIHLFELDFEEAASGQGIQVVESPHVAEAARLLGMSAESLCESLCKKTVIRPKRNNQGRDSIFKTDRTPAQAKNAQEALVKMLYKRLFEHIVAQINSSLLVAGQTQNLAESSRRQIGILDIYGFEQLKLNSFEQLCINLANERLQEFFCDKVILAEQEMYRKEGLPAISLQVESSEPLLDAIGCTLNTLHEHGLMIAKNVRTTDERFTADVHKKFGTHMCKLKRGGGKKNQDYDANLSFVVNHYAGEVNYSTAGWLEKNNATLSTEAEMLISCSDHKVVARLQGEAQSAATSVGRKYLADLDLLLSTLDACSLHYIRCFKPNLSQKPSLWEGGVILDQMRQSGGIDLVKIMHEGYPNRCSFDYLVERYQSKLPDFKDEQPRTFLGALMLAFEIPKSDYVIGASRLFLKSGCLAVLDQLTDSGDAIPPEVLKRLKKVILQKKRRRCFQAVALCLYLPKFLARAKKEKNLKMLKICAINYYRLNRWASRAKKTLRDQRVAAAIEKLRKTWRLGRVIVRLLRNARRRIACRRNQDIAFRLYPAMCRALRKWILREREKVKRRIVLWNAVKHYVTVHRFLSRRIKQWKQQQRKQLRQALDQNLLIFRTIVLLRRRLTSGCIKVLPQSRSKVYTVREFATLQKRKPLSALQRARRKIRVKQLFAAFYRRALFVTFLRRYQRSRKAGGKGPASAPTTRVIVVSDKLSLERRMRNHELWTHLYRFALMVKPWKRYVRRFRANKKRGLRTSVHINQQGEQPVAPGAESSTAPGDTSATVPVTGEQVATMMEMMRAMQEEIKALRAEKSDHSEKKRRVPSSFDRRSVGDGNEDGRQSIGTPPLDGEQNNSLIWSDVSSVKPSPSTESWGNAFDDIGAAIQSRNGAKGLVMTGRGTGMNDSLELHPAQSVDLEAGAATTSSRGRCSVNSVSPSKRQACHIAQSGNASLSFNSKTPKHAPAGASTNTHDPHGDNSSCSGATSTRSNTTVEGGRESKKAGAVEKNQQFDISGFANNTGLDLDRMTRAKNNPRFNIDLGRALGRQGKKSALSAKRIEGVPDLGTSSPQELQLGDNACSPPAAGFFQDRPHVPKLNFQPGSRIDKEFGPKDQEERSSPVSSTFTSVSQRTPRDSTHSARGAPHQTMTPNGHGGRGAAQGFYPSSNGSMSARGTRMESTQYQQQAMFYPQYPPPGWCYNGAMPPPGSTMIPEHGDQQEPEPLMSSHTTDSSTRSRSVASSGSGRYQPNSYNPGFNPQFCPPGGPQFGGPPPPPGYAGPDDVLYDRWGRPVMGYGFAPHPHGMPGFPPGSSAGGPMDEYNGTAGRRHSQPEQNKDPKSSPNRPGNMITRFVGGIFGGGSSSKNKK